MIAAESKLKIEPIRLNPHYVIWYKNVATFLLSLLIPLCLLAYWNYNTYDVLRRRRRLRNRPFLDNNLGETYLTSISPDGLQGAAHTIISGLSPITAVVMLNPLFYGAVSRRSSLQQGETLSSSRQGMTNNYFFR